MISSIFSFISSFSNISNSSLSEVSAILIASARPFKICLSGKVLKTSGSIKTFLGW